MKLYYSAGSCSTSCHLTLEESGLKYEAIKLDFDKAEDAALVKKLNPMGTLPVFITDEGKQLDQNLAIHAYVAEKAAGKNLLPAKGTPEYFTALNWLSFVAADLHKAVGGLFAVPYISTDKNIQATVRTAKLIDANHALKVLDDHLAKNDFILGKNFSPADAYAFVVCGWTKWLEIPLTPYTHIQNFMKRVSDRPAVYKALKEEGLA